MKNIRKINIQPMKGFNTNLAHHNMMKGHKQHIWDLALLHHDDLLTPKNKDAFFEYIKLPGQCFIVCGFDKAPKTILEIYKELKSKLNPLSEIIEVYHKSYDSKKIKLKEFTKITDITLENFKGVIYKELLFNFNCSAGPLGKLSLEEKKEMSKYIEDLLIDHFNQIWIDKAGNYFHENYFYRMYRQILDNIIQDILSFNNKLDEDVNIDLWVKKHVYNYHLHTIPCRD